MILRKVQRTFWEPSCDVTSIPFCSPLPPPARTQVRRNGLGGGRGVGGEGGDRMAQNRKPVNLARAFRKRLVPAEGMLWKVLRNRAVGGFKFRRQHPIGPYLADFACVECKVVVEVDGETHLRRQAQDETRTAYLVAEGWQVQRFCNPEIYEDLESVKESIYDLCAARRQRLSSPLTPDPSPPADDGSARARVARRGERGGEGDVARLLPHRGTAAFRPTANRASRR